MALGLAMPRVDAARVGLLRRELTPKEDQLLLFATNGSGALVTVDAVSFGIQARGVSAGRSVDGGTNVVAFPGTPTPGAGNYREIGNMLKMRLKQLQMPAINADPW